LIGCGNIAAYHLEAYRTAGFRVAALCNRTAAKAEALRDRFYPEAFVCTDYRDILASADIGVVDIAMHPDARERMIQDALFAGKHVLSQKPFVTDLDLGARLCDVADRRGLKLAVNQNGRWAPHWSYIRHAIDAGLIGDLTAVHFALHWDHSWTKGSVFDEMPHLILYDFGIHWFDILACFMGERPPLRVTATAARASGQQNKAPLLAQALVEYDGAQASIAFDAATPFGSLDMTYIAGTRGVIRSEGPDLNHQQVTLHTADGLARPVLEGEWFREGFMGTMGELLCAIEEDRAPYNSARDSLKGLALCFAAMASADTGRAVTPGTIRDIR
jgi:predicted dehydrogenase